MSCLFHCLRRRNTLLIDIRTSRNWRYHKIHRLWITKEPGFPEPQPLGPEAERGRYVVFNEKHFARESVCIPWDHPPSEILTMR